MNIGFLMCGIMVPCFAIISLVFAIGKEKSAILISGFNSLPKQQRDQYDQTKMAADMRNSTALWALIMLIGALASLIWAYLVIAAYVVWIVLFFKDVHFDVHKAFDKYLLK